MEISREWGRDPTWFASLPADEQVQLWAWWRVKNDPEGKHSRAKRTDLKNLRGELEAARKSSPADRPPPQRRAPSPRPPKRGGASHVKRSR